MPSLGQPSDPVPARASASTTYDRWGYVHRGRIGSIEPVSTFLWTALKVAIGLIAVLAVAIFHWIVAIIFAAILMAVAAINQRQFGTYAGKCPHCQEPFVVSASIKGMACPICAGRLMLKEGHFVAL